MTSDLVTEQTQPRILVACVGNIFFGDDGFGIEVARRLMQRQSNQYNNQYAAQVHVIDFGIRGMDLAYTLLEPYDILVIVDAVPRGNASGTLYVLEPDLTNLTLTGPTPDAHSMDPMKVLAFARLLGATPPRTLVLGCEPVPFNPEDAEMHMGLSEPVSNAIDSALQMLDALIASLLTDHQQRHMNPVVNDLASFWGRDLISPSGTTQGRSLRKSHTAFFRLSRKKQVITMAKLLILALAMGAGIVFIQALPDIQRYLRIRSM